MASASHPKVIIYTTPTCPDCWALKAWLKREEIAFEERDLSDPKIMAEAKARTGVRVAPITLVGEKVFYGTFPSQKPGLTAALGLSNNTGARAMTKNVDIRQAGRTITVPEGVTILEAALADGISYPHDCRSGRCGSCKSRLVSGEVDLLDHSRFALSDEEKAQGLILACRAIPTTNAIVAWLGGDEETPSHPRRRLNCRVTAIADATHDIKHIQLVIDGADPLAADPLAFTAGQYARLTFPGAPTRDYSMASGPGERAFEFHIRRVPGGAATQRIHALLKLGDPVLLEGPFGSSYLREQHAGPILCVAGGSGLAPIKGIVEAAIARGMKQPIHVYFGARSDRDLYLVDHFEGLAQRHPNLTFTPVLSDAPLGAGWRTGFVTDAVAKDLQDFDGWKAYVAGPPRWSKWLCRSVRHAGCGLRTCMPMCSLRPEKHRLVGKPPVFRVVFE